MWFFLICPFQRVFINFMYDFTLFNTAYYYSANFIDKIPKYNYIIKKMLISLINPELLLTVQSHLMLWNYLYKMIGIKDIVLNKIARTAFLPWTKN